MLIEPWLPSSRASASCRSRAWRRASSDWKPDFGAPPAGYQLKIEPQAPFDAQAHYLRRFEVLSEAAGYTAHAQAFDTE